jgi:hypothetical protein
MTTTNKINFFGEEFEGYYNDIVRLRESRDDWHYNILPTDTYNKMAEAAPIELAKIYWKEMLYRTHIAVNVSLFRAARWVDAMKQGYDSGIYYAFCSSLRGFIESCADSFYTLRYAPLTIAKDFEVVYKSVYGETMVLLDHKNLEDILIHFTHATKFDRKVNPDVSSVLQAKQVREYLNAVVDGDDDRLSYLYSILCQVSHPAAEANAILLFHQENKMIVCGDSFLLEKELIEAMIESFSTAITSLFRKIYGNGIESLMLLNMFHLDEIRTDFTADDILDSEETWVEVKQLIAESKIKYDNCLRTGVYT